MKLFTTVTQAFCVTILFCVTITAMAELQVTPRMPTAAAVSHNWISAISSGGAVTQSRPACADLSDSVASCSTNTTNATNITSGTLPAAQLPNPTASTLGGVESFAAVSNQWIRQISTSGVPTASQPAFTDISGVATIANGGTNNGSLGVSAGGVVYTDGSKLANLAAGTTGQVVTSAGSSAPTWSPPLPTGTLIFGAWTSCPALSIAADGSSLLRSGGTSCGGGACANLFAAISTTYGTADGTHFTLPNMSGVFPRGQGTQTISAISYSGTQGTTLGDAFQGHRHNFLVNQVVFAASDGGNVGSSSSGSVKNGTGALVVDPITDGTHGTPRTGSETMPANITLKYCIYY